MGKLVVQVDEVYEAGNWDLANKLKPLITEPTVSANIKYGHSSKSTTTPACSWSQTTVRR